MAAVLSTRWATFATGGDASPEALRFVRRAHAAYRRRLSRLYATPWIDLGGEG